MNIKWIVTDMDGTLLNERDEIPKREKEYLIACQRRGIKLILASGRSYARLMTYADELQMKLYGGVLIEVNGMAVNDLQKEKRQITKRLEKQEIHELFTWFQEREVEVQGMEDQGLYYWYPESMQALKEAERKKRNLPKDYPWVGGAWSYVEDSRDGYHKQIRVDEAKDLPETLNKINCLADPEKMQEVFQEAKEHFKDRYELYRTCQRLLEISPQGVSKGQTLKHYMEQHQISKDEVLAFGDGENDLETFRQVTYSVAMGNAEAFIKDQAYEITGTNRDGGIARTLEKYFPWLKQ